MHLHTPYIQRSLKSHPQLSQCLRLTSIPAQPILDWLSSLCNQVSANGSVPASQLNMQSVCSAIAFPLVIKKPSDRLLTYGLSPQCCISGLPISHFGIELSRGMVHPTALAQIDQAGRHLDNSLALRTASKTPLALTLTPLSALPWHLNAYATDPISGMDILMTSDHIYPRALGGPDHWANRQPMLSGLNNAKGLNLSEQDQLLWRARRTAYPFLKLRQ